MSIQDAGQVVNNLEKTPVKQSAREAIMSQRLFIPRELSAIKTTPKLLQTKEEPVIKKASSRQTPTLIKNLKMPAVAEVEVAQAHAVLSQATVQADFTQKIQAHRAARPCFSRTPKAIQKLIF